VAFESHALTAAREQLVALDAQRREAALAVEEALATAGAQLGDAAKGERLRQIRMVEEAYQVRGLGGEAVCVTALETVCCAGVAQFGGGCLHFAVQCRFVSRLPAAAACTAG
jgi:hypothetical protein